MRHPPADTSRTCEVEIELTAEEELLVRARAAAAGLSLEDFMRREILRPLSEEELADAASEEN